MNKREAVVEVRLAELPAALVVPLEESLRQAAGQLLQEAGLVFDSIRTFGTCRRLVLQAEGLAPRTREAGGRPAGPALRALAGVMPRVLGCLGPGSCGTKNDFVLCVEGLLALCGDRIVPFEFAGNKAGRRTTGLSAKGPRPVNVPAAEKYFRSLQNANVLVRDDERRAALAKELEQAARRMKLEVENDPALLAETLYLTECPVCVVGAFGQEFLKLPEALLSDVMKRKLGFFPVRDARGKLQPYFVGVRDGVSSGQRVVEEGFRNALEAAFHDAAFLAEPGSR